MQSRDGADGEVVRADAKLVPRGRDLVARSRTAELLVRRAEIDDLHLFGLHQARLDHEIGGALRHGDGDVGVALEQAIGDLLKPGRVGQVRVLVQNRGNPAHRRGHAAERRGAVPVEMEDVDLLAVDDLQERGQRRGIELRLVQIRDVDAERVERFLRQILLAQADERDVEARGIEARNHPGEQALDAVHARPFPSEVIADLQNANLVHALAHDPRRHADGRRALGHRFAHDGACADHRVGADLDAIEHLRARAQPGSIARR